MLFGTVFDLVILKKKYASYINENTHQVSM